MANFRVSFFIISIGIVNFFFKFLQGFFLWILFPVEICRNVFVTWTFCRHQIVDKHIKSHFMATMMIHWQTRMNTIEYIKLVILTELLLKSPYFFELGLLEIILWVRSKSLLVLHICRLRSLPRNTLGWAFLRAFHRRPSLRFCRRWSII